MFENLQNIVQTTICLIVYAFEAIVKVCLLIIGVVITLICSVFGKKIPAMFTEYAVNFAPAYKRNLCRKLFDYYFNRV